LTISKLTKFYVLVSFENKIKLNIRRYVMKRIKYIASLLAIVGIFSAQAAEVNSVNMVGFAKVNLGQGLNIIGAPFLTVGDTAIHINDLFDTSEFTAGMAPNDSDVITVWSGTGYDTYFLSAFAPPSWSETAWVNISGTAQVDITLQPGNAVWLNRQAAAADITFKGEVMAAASTDIALSTGLNMISYPYSVDGKLADFDISSATAGMAPNDSDVVTVWTGSGYDTYFLSAFAPPSWSETAWVNISGTAQVDVDLPIGKGVWYNAQAATTGISADKPY